MRVQGWCGRLNSRTQNAAADDGFTLIELIIVIVILPLVIGGVAAALLAILQNESTTFNRVGDSADAQITSANFSRDIQSAYRLTTGTSATICQGALVGATPLLGLQGSETITRTFPDGSVAAGSPTLTAPSGDAYFSAADNGSLVTDALQDIQQGTTVKNPGGFNSMLPNQLTMSQNAQAGSGGAHDSVTLTLTKSWMATYWENPVGTSNQLVREFCVGSGPNSNTYLASSSEIVAHDLPSGQGFSVTCSPGLAASQCNSNGWLSMNSVAGVTLSAAEPASGYQFNLSASPRNSNTEGSAVPALTVTSGGLVVPGTLNINGQLSFNTPGSQLTGSGAVNINASSGPPAITEVQCGSQCSQVTGSFAPIGPNSGLQCNASACPTATSISSAAPQPSVPAPSYPNASGPGQTCATSGNTMTCPPGYYQGPVTPGSTVSSVVFLPGNYLFGVNIGGAGGVIIGNPVTSVVFGSGTYAFSASSGLQLNAPNINVTGTGVFFYFSAGSLSTQSDNVQLTAPTTGPYAGQLIFQIPSDSASMTLSATAQAGTASSFGGTVDATGASVLLGSIGDNFGIGTLWAQSVSLGSSSTTVTVGARSS